jgi:hypothetical protein
MVTFGNMKAHIFTVLTLTLCSLASSAQTFNDGTAGLTNNREIKQARKAHMCKLIGDMNEAALMFLNRERDEEMGIQHTDQYAGWLYMAMNDMFRYRNAYPVEFMTRNCHNRQNFMDMKMMQDASTKLLVELELKSAEYAQIRAVDDWRDFFFGIN